MTPRAQRNWERFERKADSDDWAGGAMAREWGSGTSWRLRRYRLCFEEVGCGGCADVKCCDVRVTYSTMTQWKRAGPITLKSLDRNELVLNEAIDKNFLVALSEPILIRVYTLKASLNRSATIYEISVTVYFCSIARSVGESVYIHCP